MPDVVNPFFSPVVRGAETTARKAGYRVLLCNSEGDLGSSASISRISFRTGSKACCSRRPATIRGTASSRCCAAIFRSCCSIARLPDLDCDLIVSDSAAGARRLVEHLIAVGHRDIAHLTDADDTSTGRERLRGYREALAAAGIAYREELVFRTTVDQIGGYRATQQVLALDPLPTAIFTVNNMTVVGAMQALRERGLSVPAGHGLWSASTTSSIWPCCRRS